MADNYMNFHDGLNSNYPSFAEHSGPMSKYSEKCDVYSWGIILWEMLARKRPYEADFEMRDTIKIMLHVVLEQGRPRQLVGCPQELNDLINA